jgi:hypothetical protein
MYIQPITTMVPEVSLVHQYSPADAKIRLFRSLFRGRDDIYPRRFESRKTGRSGYAPACANEWVRGICEKPKVKCADCQFRQFLPVTDNMIRWHLSGFDPAGEPFVAGVYPMLRDETCFFLAVDFDKDGWQEAARAFLEGCRAVGVSAALERSRSGRGGHVWLFFEEAITAVSARRLGSFILTESMDRHSSISFGSYDRFFPNQDTLPSGGFGNLVALHFKSSREIWATAFSWMTTSFRTWTNGHFCSRFPRFLEFTLRKSCGKPSAVDVWSVFACRRWTRKRRSPGPRRRHGVGSILR